VNAKKVTAALIWKSGKLPIAQRLKEDRFSRKWEFPGGKLEEGESPEQCLKRELQEEFGVNAAIGDFLGRVSSDYGESAIELLVHESSDKSTILAASG
jgi:8-oxo-dGTP diphosphatase